MKSFILRELTRAFLFSFFAVLFTSLGIMSVAYAASNGGTFGNLLNAILASGDWSNPGDGTVKNAANLAGAPASAYARLKPGQSCGPNTCIAGITADGTIQCR